MTRKRKILHAVFEYPERVLGFEGKQRADDTERFYDAQSCFKVIRKNIKDGDFRLHRIMVYKIVL
jgi:hypothetical protein